MITGRLRAIDRFVLYQYVDLYIILYFDLRVYLFLLTGSLFLMPSFLLPVPAELLQSVQRGLLAAI